MAFSDNFNRADENPLAGNWTTVPGALDMRLLTNQARGISNNTHGRAAYWNTDLSSADHFCEVKLTLAGQDGGPLVRSNKTDETYYGYNALDAGGSIFKSVGGVFTSLAARNATFPGVCRISVNGSTIKVYKDGVQIGADFTDTAITGGVAVAICDFGNTPQDLDDFLADVLTAPTEPGIHFAGSIIGNMR